ncbi:MAG: type II toxin-antitoxin system Phd/YefM family antitoxin [Desulfobulbaceae bacterium]|nr:type II toxin-antitoxin system Phd/YefM family antitoxin [Desulfobulbaceae bacterium]
MITINIHEAKTHLSHYLDEVEKGERVVLCKRNRPIAEIRPLGLKLLEKRPIGLAGATFSLPTSFFDDLPEETIAMFSGVAY